MFGTGRIRRRSVLVGAFVLTTMGIVILWPRSNFENRVAAIPKGSSREAVYTELGSPNGVMPIHGPEHEWVREVWIYPGPLKVAPMVSFSPLRVSLFDRNGGPRISFDTFGRVESVALPEGRKN